MLRLILSDSWRTINEKQGDKLRPNLFVVCHYVLERCALRSAHTRGDVARTCSGDKPLSVRCIGACCRDSTQAGAHEANWGIKSTEITESAWELALMECNYWFSLFCSGDSLQEQCTLGDTEHWGHFVPATWHTNSNLLNFVQHVAGTKFCPRNRILSQLENRDVTRGKLSLQNVPAACPCNMYPSVCRPLVNGISHMNLDIKTSFLTSVGSTVRETLDCGAP